MSIIRWGVTIFYLVRQKSVQNTIEQKSYQLLEKSKVWKKFRHLMGNASVMWKLRTLNPQQMKYGHIAILDIIPEF